MLFKAIKAITKPKESGWGAVITMDGKAYPIHKNFLEKQTSMEVAVIDTPKKTDLVFGLTNGEPNKATKDSSRINEQTGEPWYKEGESPTYEQAGIAPTPRVTGLVALSQALAQKALGE